MVRSNISFSFIICPNPQSRGGAEGITVSHTDVKLETRIRINHLLCQSVVPQQIILPLSPFLAQASPLPAQMRDSSQLPPWPQICCPFPCRYTNSFKATSPCLRLG